MAEKSSIKNVGSNLYTYISQKSHACGTQTPIYAVRGTCVCDSKITVRSCMLADKLDRPCHDHK